MNLLFIFCSKYLFRYAILLLAMLRHLYFKKVSKEDSVFFAPPKSPALPSYLLMCLRLQPLQPSSSMSSRLRTHRAVLDGQSPSVCAIDFAFCLP